MGFLQNLGNGYTHIATAAIRTHTKERYGTKISRDPQQHPAAIGVVPRMEIMWDTKGPLITCTQVVQDG